MEGATGCSQGLVHSLSGDKCRKALICGYFGVILVVRPQEPEIQDVSLSSAGFTFSTSDRNHESLVETHFLLILLVQEILTQ